MGNRFETMISVHDAEALGLMLGEWPRRHRQDEEAADALADKLAGARVVASDQVPEGVVTMNSTVTYIESPEGRHQTVTIVYPARADAGAGRVSVLSPIGQALLGRSVRSMTDVVLPTGRRLALWVADVSRRSTKDEEALALV